MLLEAACSSPSPQKLPTSTSPSSYGHLSPGRATHSSLPLPQPLLQGCRGRTSPRFLPEQRKERRAGRSLGRPSVGREGKVSIKAMRPSTSPCLTARVSGADRQSAGCLPRLARCPHAPPAPNQLGQGTRRRAATWCPLSLPPEMLLITVIIMIPGLSRPRRAWRQIVMKQPGLGGKAERGSGSGSL